MDQFKGLKKIRRCVGKLGQIFYYKVRSEDVDLKNSETMIKAFKEWGFYNERYSGKPRILMAAGHGYGNVGDEAQCGACIDRWRRVAPDARITLFTPNPAYTSALHGEEVTWAPRVAWFGANTSGTYFQDGRRFTLQYVLLRWRLEISCRFIRANIPFSLLRPSEMQVVQDVRMHDLLHISGGGFLTGKTRSRLWENCLLMRVCQLLNKPYILTGHNIGVFQTHADRRVAHMGLKKAFWIGLRDRGISEKELAGIGIKGDHVQSECDDALLCPRLPVKEVFVRLQQLGVDPARPWVAVQFHTWGQAAEKQQSIRKLFAEHCDRLVRDLGLQVVVISMTPSDVEPETLLLDDMKEKGFLVPYSPDFRVVRGVIADSALVLTFKHHPIVFAQGEGVPVVSVALDDYYQHKNLGALENTGHGEYLVTRDQMEGDAVLSLCRKALAQSDQIRTQMAVWVEKMREKELDLYLRFGSENA
jgi:polysaccharide pyruvyl transferase WcaK-like protein